MLYSYRRKSDEASSGYINRLHITVMASQPDVKETLLQNETFRELVQILHFHSEEFASLDDDNIVPYIREFAKDTEKFHQVIKDLSDQVLLLAVIGVIAELEGYSTNDVQRVGIQHYEEFADMV